MANTQNTQTQDREFAIDALLEYLGKDAEGATVIRDTTQHDLGIVLTQTALYSIRTYVRSATAQTGSAEVTRTTFGSGFAHLSLRFDRPEAAPQTETVYLTREARDAAVLAKASLKTPAKSPCYCDYTFHPGGC